MLIPCLAGHFFLLKRKDWGNYAFIKSHIHLISLCLQDIISVVSRQKCINFSLYKDSQCLNKYTNSVIWFAFSQLSRINKNTLTIAVWNVLLLVLYDSSYDLFYLSCSCRRRRRKVLLHLKHLWFHNISQNWKVGIKFICIYVCITGKCPFCGHHVEVISDTPTASYCNMVNLSNFFLPSQWPKETLELCNEQLQTESTNCNYLASFSHAPACALAFRKYQKDMAWDPAFS